MQRELPAANGRHASPPALGNARCWPRLLTKQAAAGFPSRSRQNVRGATDNSAAAEQSGSQHQTDSGGMSWIRVQTPRALESCRRKRVAVGPIRWCGYRAADGRPHRDRTGPKKRRTPESRGIRLGSAFQDGARGESRSEELLRVRWLTLGWQADPTGLSGPPRCRRDQCQG
jgi:hypothetical protein